MVATLLRYGADSTLEIDAGPEISVVVCDVPRGRPVVDPAKSLADALAAPLDFPPLVQAIIPGDRVVVALGIGIPQAGTMTAVLVEALLHAGVGAADIGVLLPTESADVYAHQLEIALPESVRRRIEIITHDPARRDQLSYLAANDQGQGIYVNRRLSDADVVLPIGCLRLDSAPNYFGVNSASYPTFSDTATIDRFRESDPADSAKRRRDADEAAWLLGVLLTIQLVPGAGGDILHLVAGSGDAVRREGVALCQAAWSCDVSRRADLVVAAVTGDGAEQTWENVGRAVAAASRVVTADGAIAICTQLSQPPGPAVRAIGGAQDFDEAMQILRDQNFADSGAARELLQALERNRIYLLSKLDESVVEDLGLAPVESAADIGRLARRHDSCLLLANAQYAQPTLNEELAERTR